MIYNSEWGPALRRIARIVAETLERTRALLAAAAKKMSELTAREQDLEKRESELKNREARIEQNEILIDWHSSELEQKEKAITPLWERAAAFVRAAKAIPEASRSPAMRAALGAAEEMTTDWPPDYDPRGKGEGR